MPCYHPLPGWYSKTRNAKTGRRPITFRFADGYKDQAISVPCGRCIGCRLEKARQWAVRCMHESAMHRHNCFVTLTYNNSSIDGINQSLRPRDFVLFMKQLRWKYGPGIRFFQCGEYGDKLLRPHHHAILFNHDFPDRKLLPGTDMGRSPLYSSAQLSELWPHGFSSIGNVTFQSAGYIARYALKKVNNERAAAHYQGKVPEYLTMSRRPGIGAGWIDRFKTDIYPSDELIVNGKITKPPRYYDERISKKNESMIKRVKATRKRKSKEEQRMKESTQTRLNARETVKTAAIQLLTRRLER